MLFKQQPYVRCVIWAYARCNSSLGEQYKQKWRKILTLRCKPNICLTSSSVFSNTSTNLNPVHYHAMGQRFLHIFFFCYSIKHCYVLLLFFLNFAFPRFFIWKFTHAMLWVLRTHSCNDFIFSISFTPNIVIKIVLVSTVRVVNY